MGHHLAIDLGAESGRAILGSFDGRALRLEEIHRFPNQPVRLGGALHWDFLRLFHEIRAGIELAARRTDGRLDSIGADSWGVDYGLLGEGGDLLSNPVHYRDGRTAGAMEEVFRRVPREEIFRRTGLQFLQLNTLFQLHAERRDRPERLRSARRLLLMADLVHHFLAGSESGESTLASTTQLLEVKTGAWSVDLMRALDLPASILPPIVPPATVLGPLLAELTRECGLREPPRVVAPACHDTAAAVAAVPSGEDDRWAYISSGTWSLVGIELEAPDLSARTLAENFTNEGGVGGRIRFLKNLMGLWPLQESRRQWEREGRRRSHEEIDALARAAPPLRSLIHPGDPSFFAPGDLPARIREFCARSGQPVPASDGEIARTVLESLALAYRATLDRIEEITGRRLERIHVVGGGSRNRLLNCFTAAATRRKVVAGPVEATAAGNALLQATALGELADLGALRAVVRASFETEIFLPGADRAAWDEAYGRFQRLAGSP